MVFDAEQCAGEPEKSLQCEPDHGILLGVIRRKPGEQGVGFLDQLVTVQVGLQLLVILRCLHNAHALAGRPGAARQADRQIELTYRVLPEKCVDIDPRRDSLPVPAGYRLVPPDRPFIDRAAIRRPEVQHGVKAFTIRHS